MPASSTAAKVAIPARRAVSPRRAEAASLPNNARKPARKRIRTQAERQQQRKASDLRHCWDPTVSVLYFFREAGGMQSAETLICAVRAEFQMSPAPRRALPSGRYLPLLLQRVASFAPIANSAVHGNDVGVSHFLQIVGGQRGAEAAATIEDELSSADRDTWPQCRAR